MSFATDYNSPDKPGSLTPRGVFVPPWYQPHSDLALEVKSQKGQPLGFTIGDVAVERRWAIDAIGQVMPGHDFKDKLTEWYIGQWTWQSPPQPPMPIDTVSYPTPEAYVSKGPNPGNLRQLITINPPGDRRTSATAERPVDPGMLSKLGWKPAPVKE